MKKILVFTDLDGSLLDHDDYSWSKAIPALKALDKKSFPIIFTSSKTAAEIVSLKEDLGNHHPFICENGAVSGIPVNYFESNGVDKQQQNESHLFGQSYENIISILNELRNSYHYQFCGFSDMDTEEVIKNTGLDIENANKAKQREASEPLLWKGASRDFKDFVTQLEKKNLIVTSGGRFYHVMSDVNKGKAVKWLLEKYRDTEPETEWITIGIGDSFNDIPMLEVVDYPVFISNVKSCQPDLTHINNLQRPQLPGSAGWNQAVLSLLTKVL